MTKHEPLPRYRHISESVRNRVLVHGGRTKDFSERSRNQLANAVEIFNPYSELWEQKQTDGETLPPGTCEAASASIRNRLYAFGGLCSTKESNALHRLDTKRWRWSQLAPQNAEGAPLPKFGCGMVAFSSESGENLGVFAGHALPHRAQQLPSGTFLKNKDHADGSGFTNEFHVFNLMKGMWSCPVTTGDIPPPCSHFTFTALDNRRAVLFGGFNTIQGFMNDVYIVDLYRKNWIKLQKPKGMDWPAERSAHAACCLNYGHEYPQLLVTGGTNGQSMPFTDIWILDIRLRKWRMMVLSEPLKPRWGHTVAATYLKPGFTELTMFGGTAIPWKGSDDRQPKLAKTTLLEFGVVESCGHSQWELLSVSLQQGSHERVYKKMQTFINHKLPAIEDDQEGAMERADYALQEKDNAWMRLREAEKERDRVRKEKCEVEREIKQAKTEAVNMKKEKEKISIQLQQTEMQKNKTMDLVRTLQAERDRVLWGKRQVEIQMEVVMKEKIEKEKQLRSAVLETEQAKSDTGRAIMEKMQADTENTMSLQFAEQRAIMGKVLDLDEKRKSEGDTLKVMVEKQQATGERDFARAQNMQLEQVVEKLKAEREETEKKREKEMLEVEKERDHMFMLNQDMQGQRDKAIMLAKQLEEERDGALAEKQKMQEQRDRAMVWAQQAESESESGKVESKQAQEERDRAKLWAQQADEQKKEAIVEKLQAESNMEKEILKKMDAEHAKERAIFEQQNAVNEAKKEKAMRQIAEIERDKLMIEKHEAEEAMIRALAAKEQAEREIEYALAYRKQVEEERDNALVYKELAERARDFAEMKWEKADGEIERLVFKKHVAENDRCRALMDKLQRDGELHEVVAEKQHAEGEWERAKKEAEEERTRIEMELQQALHEKESLYQEKKQAEIDRDSAQEENVSLKQERDLVISEKLQMENERDFAMNRQVEAECRAEELQRRMTRFEEHEQEQIVIREQALNADLRGPSWEVEEGEIEVIDESLGSGGWAEVKVAHLKVAAKCLHPQLVYEYHTDTFKREMSIAAKISHPNVLRFLGARLEGNMAILTEFMPTSLREEINRCYLDEEQRLSKEHVLSIGVDVSCALNYLHSFSPDPIVHRDISSANVLLQPTKKGGWFAKLSDYGTANFNSQLQTQNPGNPVYTAPEASDPSKQTPKMDVYSFGVLLIEMCKCEFPVRERRSELLESIEDNHMQALIVQCLNEDQVQRPNAAQLVSVLQTIQRDL